MDQNQQLGEDFKKQIHEEMAEIIISALENNEIKLEDAQNSADFVAERFETIKTNQELLLFLEELVKSWPVYQKVYEKVKSQKVKSEEQTKINDIQNTLDNLNDNQTQ